MSDEIFRPIAKRIYINKSRLIIHPYAEPAFRIWYEFYIKKPRFNLQPQNGYYQVSPKIVSGKLKDNYLFFENFEYMNFFLSSENTLTVIHGLVIPESKQDIEMCAWAEVLRLPFHNKVNYAEFYYVLKNTAPTIVIQKLMDVKRLDKSKYLKFYGIDNYTFDNHQRNRKHSKRKQLPKMSVWIRKAP